MGAARVCGEGVATASTSHYVPHTTLINHSVILHTVSFASDSLACGETVLMFLGKWRFIIVVQVLGF